MLYVVKVSSKSDRDVCFWVRLPTCPSLVHSSRLLPLQMLLFHSVLTKLHLLSALTNAKGKRNRAVYLGVSHCLGQAGNWERCTVATISTWLSSSMNNTATLLVLASACGAPLSLPPANTFLFLSVSPPSIPPHAPPLHFLLLECACLPGADSETNTCRTGRCLCRLKPCLNCCGGDQWGCRTM